MNDSNQPSQRSEDEGQILEWVGRNYGSEVREESCRILDEQRGTRELCAEILEEALYRLHRQDVDNALMLGEQCFNSD